MLLPVAAAPVASGETWTHRDGRRDVAAVQYNIPLDGFVIKAAPKNRHADITRVTVDHAADRLKVRVDLRDVTRVRRLYRQLRARIVTPDESFLLDTGPRPGPGRPSIVDAERQAVRCPDLSFEVRVGADEVVLSVPTTCLGSPETLRFGVTYISTYGTVTYRDDPLRGRIRQLRDARLSPPIAVG